MEAAVQRIFGEACCLFRSDPSLSGVAYVSYAEPRASLLNASPRQSSLRKQSAPTVIAHGAKLLLPGRAESLKY
jgi:hypothetical protein